MKKFLALILSLTLAATLLVGLASCKDKTSGDDGKVDYTWDITDGVLNSFKVTDKAKELIAEKNYAELANGFNASKGDTFTADSVKELDLLKAPAKITKIGANAVADLSYIEKIKVPDTVTEIELGAFSNLSSLKSITLPFVGGKKGGQAEKKLFGYIFGTASSASLTSCTQTYNGGDKDNTATYYVPTSLETVVITGEIKKETETVKYYIEDGKQIKVTETNKGEGKEILTKEVDSYADNAIMPYAFCGITTVKDVTVTGGAIFDGTFKGCTSLKNVTVNGENVVIGRSAFDGCTSLKADIFAKVTEIGEGAFKGCASLGKSTVFTTGNLDLSNVTKIGESAFDGCTEMTTLTLKADVALGEKAFNGCSKLIKVTKGGVEYKPEKEGENKDKVFTNCNENLYAENAKTEETK